MNSRRLSREFYAQPTLDVASQMLGKYLVRRSENGKKQAGKIAEIEVYKGANDKASHAYGGKVTSRNRAEWMQGGHVYIYLVYGMYWQLNISTYKEGEPECILIRALDATEFDIPFKETSGPGKLCRWLELDKSFYAEDLAQSDRIWLEERDTDKYEKNTIVATPRIGIDYAGPFWARRKWRFLLKEYQSQLPKAASKYCI